MRFVEDYWQDFIDFGFIKTETNGRIDYTLPKEIGSGGFSISTQIGRASCRERV